MAEDWADAILAGTPPSEAEDEQMLLRYRAMQAHPLHAVVGRWQREYRARQRGHVME